MILLVTYGINQFGFSNNFSVENIGEEPVITTTNGNISVTIGSGIYAGTYTQRVPDSAQLTVAMVEAAPTPIVRPVITGTETVNETLTVTPGLWLYSGDDKGDQTFPWLNDIDGPTGITILTYVLTASDVNDTMSVDETYGGETILSLSTGVISAATMAPVLTLPIDDTNGATASTGSVSTDQDDGTLYWVVTTSATPPSAAQVKLGQDNSGVAATDSGSQVVSATGVQAITPAPSGLSAATAYTTHFMHENVSLQQSSVSSASGFTTDAITIATDTAAIQWLDPNNVVTSGGGTVLDEWPNSAVSGSALYDMSVVPTGSTAPSWDSVNKFASNSGTQALVSSNIGTSPFTEASLAADTYCFFAVADISALGFMWALGRDDGNNFMAAFGVGDASTPIRAAVGLRRSSSAFGALAFGVQGLTNSIAPGKHLHELRFNDTTANFYVDGSLEWTGAVSASGNTHQGLNDFYATLFGWGNQTVTNASRRAQGDLYELLITTDLTNADTYRTELATRHSITI